jgi:hypothetical protein
MQSKSWCFPGRLLVLMLAGWINRHQQAVIAYQREETKVLREMLGGKRLRFTDGQRRRLALKSKALSRCDLRDLGPLVTPDTLCRWFRKYAGAKYDSSGQRRPGRPPKPQYVRNLVVRLAQENTSWGCTKLRDVIFTLGHVPEGAPGCHRGHRLLQGRSDDTSSWIAIRLLRKGEYARAETLMLARLESTKRLLGDKHPDVAQALTTLAALRMADGDGEGAEQALREALE